MIKLEMHAHTKEVSPCGQLWAAELVELYHQGGYGGLVITDHYFDGYFRSLEENLEDKNWEAQVDAYLRGGVEARKAAEAHGMRVYHGLELRFKGSNNDYLVYGVTRDFLLTHPRLDQLTPAMMRHLCDQAGLLLFQAHPFRPGLTREDPCLLDGLEVHNGHPFQENHNDLALSFAREHHLPFLSGSDCHDIRHACRGGILCNELPEGEEGLVALLRQGNYELIASEEFLSMLGEASAETGAKDVK